jgi:hypothetical protein
LSFELPLLLEKGLISLSSVTKIGNGVTKFSSVENHHLTIDDENQLITAQNQSLGRE